MILFSFADVFRVGIWTRLNLVEDDFLRQLAKRLPAMALRSRQEKTIQNYVNSFIRWRNWAQSFPEITHLPADPLYVSLYLLHLSDSAKTHAPVSLAFYAISWAHRCAGLDDPTKTPLPKMVKESATRSLGQGSNKKSPVTPDMLKDIVLKYSNLDSDISNLRIATICLIAYSGFLRFDELAHLRYCDVSFSPEYAKLFIERSKTDVYRAGQCVYIARLFTAFCPVAMLERYLTRAGFNSYSEKFIFRAVTRNKDVRKRVLKRANKPLSYSTLRTIVLQAFTSVGVDASVLGTHSLRAGGATTAANLGIPDRLFKKHGRWTSDGSKDRYVSESIKHKLLVTKNLGL